MTIERNIGYPGGYIASNGYVYQDEELVLIVEESIDYWTRLEHQYAGMAMQGMITHYGEIDEMGDLSILSNQCVMVARDLVEKLKSESNG